MALNVVEGVGEPLDRTWNSCEVSIRDSEYTSVDDSLQQLVGLWAEELGHEISALVTPAEGLPMRKPEAKQEARPPSGGVSVHVNERGPTHTLCILSKPAVYHWVWAIREGCANLLHNMCRNWVTCRSSDASGELVRLTPAFSGGPGGAPLARHRSEPTPAGNKQGA